MRHIKEDIAEILKDMLPNFTSEQIKEALQLRGWSTCSIPWLSECLRNFGYVYDRINKFWYKKPIVIDSISIATHNDIIKKYENKLEKLEDKIGEILTGIANDDYCSKCRKKIICKHYNLGESGIAKLFARTDICKAHKELIKEITVLHDIFNEEDEIVPYNT